MSVLSLARQAAAVNGICGLVRTLGRPSDENARILAGQLGHVSVKHEDNLYQFNYTAAAQFSDGEWNDYEQVCRGLVIHKDGFVVAWPFEKFWNWGEGGRTSDAAVKTVYEKLDGSLGICFYDPDRMQWRIVTRGSFNSPQAIWATEWLHSRFRLVGIANATLLFEIIYPDNLIVVDYGNRAELVLLAVRSHEWPVSNNYWSDAGVDILAKENGYPRPRRYDIKSVADIEAAIKGSRRIQEGYVALMADGSRWKFKTEQYRKLHRFLNKMTYKHVVEAVAADQSLEIYRSLPGHLRPQWHELCSAVVVACNNRIQEVQTAYESAWGGCTDIDRKQFAQWATAPERRHMAPYLFAMLDDRPILPVVFKQMLKGT